MVLDNMQGPRDGPGPPSPVSAGSSRASSSSAPLSLPHGPAPSRGTVRFLEPPSREHRKLGRFKPQTLVSGPEAGSLQPGRRQGRSSSSSSRSSRLLGVRGVPCPWERMAFWPVWLPLCVSSPFLTRTRSRWISGAPSSRITSP